MEFGIWPSEFALGEKFFYAARKGIGYSDESSKSDLRSYLKYPEDMERQQKWAKYFLESIGNAAGNNNALFGTPIDTSKENCNRMHMITVSMGKDTGKHDHTPHAYNPAIVPLYILKNKNGTYVTLSGASTTDQEKARHYTDRAEIESHRLSTQEIVEV